MSNSNIEIQSSNDSNECIDLIGKYISKKIIRYYEYNHFSNFQEIGSGGFGIVYRANWKNLEEPFALKSFFNDTVKEIFHEVIKIRMYINLICEITNA